jgi:hypothetical protein
MLTAIAILTLLAIPLALAEQTMTIELETHRKYYNPTIGDYVKHASFYLFGGEDIQWWSGGAKFIYALPSEVAKEKIDTLTRHLMELFRDLGFIIVAGTVKPVYVKVVYAFDGVLEYEGFYFADGNGIVIVEWSLGKPLVVTIEATATINASTAKYLGKADWEYRYVNGGYAIGYPELAIPKPKTETYELLVVPREGFSGITETVRNYWGNETRTVLLGGGPEIYKIDPTAYGYTLRDSGTFYGRFPALEIVYDQHGKTIYRLDWFWNIKTPT